MIRLDSLVLKISDLDQIGIHIGSSGFKIRKLSLINAKSIHLEFRKTNSVNIFGLFIKMQYFVNTIDLIY